MNLSVGKHPSPYSGTCVMEHISMLAGDEFTDYPSCTEPAVAQCAQTVNDCLGDIARNAFLPMYIERVMHARPLPLAENAQSLYEKFKFSTLPHERAQAALLSTRDFYQIIGGKHLIDYRYPRVSHRSNDLIEDLGDILDHHDMLLHNFARAEAMSRALHGLTPPENPGTCAACLETEEVFA